MKRTRRVIGLLLSILISAGAIVLTMLALSSNVAAQDEPEGVLGMADLAVEATAPEYVAADSAYIVNLSYANIGTAWAEDNWLQATIPDGTAFFTATNKWDDPMPPDLVSGNTMTWSIHPLSPDSTWGHVFLTLLTDEGLPEGTELTTTVEIATSAAESDLSNNRAGVVSTIGAMAGSTKQAHAGHVMPADVLSYTIYLSPSLQLGGGANGRWVTITDTLPMSNQVRFLGWSGEVTGTVIEGHQLQWELQLYAGEALTLQYRLGVEGDVAAGTPLTNVAMLGWSGHHMRLGPVTTTVTLPENMLGLGAEQAGVLQATDGTMLQVPAGAVSDTTRFEFRAWADGDGPIVPPGGLTYTNRAFVLNAFRFGDGVGTFSGPLTLTAHYSETDVAGLLRESLQLGQRNGPDDPWTLLGAPDLLTDDSLVYAIDTLGQFALFAEPVADLAVDIAVPEHVAADSAYIVNLSFANIGTAWADDNWLQATIPDGTTFFTATNKWDDPMPPDLVSGDTMTWNIHPLSPDSTWGHVFLTLRTDQGLSPGTMLTVTAEIGTASYEVNLDNNQASTMSYVGEMAGSTKQAHAGHIMPADVLSYTIYLSPSLQLGGGANGRWVTLTDTLPMSNQVRFLGWSGDVTGTLIDGHQLQWELQLYAGEALTLQYRLGVEGDVAPGTPLTNVAMLGWSGYHMRLGPVTTTVTLPENMLGLGAEQAGVLQATDGTMLQIPAGAVSDTTRFEFHAWADGDGPIVPPGGLTYTNRAFVLSAFRFGDGVGTFSGPLTLTAHYSETDVAGLLRESLQLGQRNGPDDPWTLLGEPDQVTADSLVYAIDSLGQFALFAEPVADLAVDIAVPEHVAADSAYIVNLSFANIGTALADDNWLQATIPDGTTFFTATNKWDDPMPPDLVSGDTMTWNIHPLSPDSTWGHVFLTLRTDQGLSPGTMLTVTAEVGTASYEVNLNNNQASAMSYVGAMAGSTKQAHAGHIMPADVLSYTITISPGLQLGGGANGRWVTVTDTLPISRQVRFLGWSGDVTGTVIEGHQLQWELQIFAGEPLTLQYRLGVEGDVAPGTPLTNVAMLGWSGYQMKLGPVTTTVTLPENMLGLGPMQAGELHTTGGVTLTMPPGAVTDTARFEFRAWAEGDGPIVPPGGLTYANRAFKLSAFRFGDGVGTFSGPLTLTVHYSETDVAGLLRNSLQLGQRNGPDEPWTPLGEPDQLTADSLVYAIDSMGQYALFGDLGPRIYLPLVMR